MSDVQSDTYLRSAKRRLALTIDEGGTPEMFWARRRLSRWESLVRYWLGWWQR